ncbi:YceI family protein [Tistrella mobilis]|uniref:YceI family protein n=1 Tax=Tistrella mobilis TaxID=171437 RepID=UPI0035572832
MTPTMKTVLSAAILSLGLGLAAVPAPATAQEVPGAADPSRVAAGRYTADPSHTQITFTVDHFGFNAYRGIAGGATGTLQIDPADPSKARVAMEIPVDGLVTTSAELDEHLRSPDFFDMASHPTITFRSTAVEVDGLTAKITGDLTIRGVTKPVVLDARFTGAGINPMNQAATIGFEAGTTIRRSDFGMTYIVPMVSDEVMLEIGAAFEAAS